MKLKFSPGARDDYLFWQQHDKAILDRINSIIKDAVRSSFQGIGKPEPLVGQMKGLWSRRIIREHRFIYRISGAGQGQALEIAACRFHYGR